MNTIVYDNLKLLKGKESLENQEIIYKAEKRNLQILNPNVPVSIQEAYSLLNIDISSYILYSHFRENGYQVFQATKIANTISTERNSKKPWWVINYLLFRKPILYIYFNYNLSKIYRQLQIIRRSQLIDSNNQQTMILGKLFDVYKSVNNFSKNKSKPLFQLHMQRQAQAGYFPLNRAKFEYEELAEQYSPDDSTGKKVLVAALLKRAVEAVTRVLRIRDEKPPLQGMVKEGIVNEGLWEKLLAAEAEIELEMQELMEESNLYKPNWSASFLQEVSQLVQMKMQQAAQQEQQSMEAQQQNMEAQQQEQSSEKQPLDEQAERERIARELIEEEEKEKKQKKKGKK
ncbi:translocation protein S66 [Boothiomyces macroporosus]|uniref:Translocation protein S66 n=1 Tax=Boothiomyces macroporosus TaxID=261099 RepID=A0AAD5Y8X7_9FUNG|nr:translocation protein S66 [Boothiomyces macroporosus]